MIYIRPRSPWINGIVEKLNGILDRHTQIEPVTFESPYRLIQRAVECRNVVRNRATGCVPDELHASSVDSELRIQAIQALSKQHQEIRKRSISVVSENEKVQVGALVLFGEEQVPAHGGS